MAEPLSCSVCAHAAHDPSCCKQCNCGEAGISHRTSYRELTMTGGDSLNGSTLTRYGYDMGHTVPKRKALD